MAIEKAGYDRTATKRSAGASSGTGGRLLEYLLARAPDEDVAAYDEADLERAAALAERAVASHSKGASTILIDAGGDVSRQGRPVTVITIVNDNMPFLFDSVIGEINEAVGEAFFVAHPVLNVRHDAAGGVEILGDTCASSEDAGADRLSVIQVHVARMNADEASLLEQKLSRTLEQVRAAVHDWKPMLARLDAAISDFRHAPVPLEQEAVREAIAFLEWLRDDNFTFLGMREYRYSGGEESGTLELADTAGLGILGDP
ncbi:MAG: NAD-glutamate dehydrogenase, partial [Aquamicrobium sp.]